jgi:hypothetical protein
VSRLGASALTVPSPHVGQAKAGAAVSMASATPANITFMVLLVIQISIARYRLMQLQIEHGFAAVSEKDCTLC